MRRIGRRRLLALMMTLATISTLLAAPVGANPGVLQTDCAAAPSTIASEDLMRGMTGTGYTAIQGAEPVEFDVEILGVLPDAIGLGLDMILARASGPVIDQVGGVAAGMSGSPIYIGGDLVGALAYGLSGTDDVFGITPAAAMASILDYPATTAPASTPMSMSIDGAMVEMAGRQRVFTLPLPMAVSGINPGRLALLNARSGIQADAVVPSGNNDGGGSGGASMRPALPGEPLSVVLSQGDVSFFATGTATLCRDNQTIAFGHPATFRGKTSMGMATADIITVIDDESGLFGNYKIATLGEVFGRIDRDHLAGVRGIDGELPTFVPISSTVTFDELSRSRMGHTKALEERFLPDIAFTHIFANIDSVFDAVGEGSSEIVFTIEGLRADGSPFSVDRTNLYSSMFDISFESAFELPTYLSLLLFNAYEDVSISGIGIESLDLVSEAREWSITDATVTTAEGTVTDGLISVQPGEEITIDVTLSGGGMEVFETLTLSIPQDIGFGFGSLVVMGAGDGGGFFEEPPPPDQASGEPGSFDELLEDLSTRPANSDVVARLEIFSEENPAQGTPSIVTSTVTTDRVVRGSQYFDVTTFGDPGFPEGINVTLTGEGFGNAYLEIGESNIFFDVFAETETPVTAIHIHRGFEGEDGPVVVDFDYPNLGSTGNVEADPEVLAEITANPAGFYVNVHTEAFPNGAIRGQIEDAEAPVDPPAEGSTG
ncbi:MAG: CHRD domain-containing protein, partial [Acidimicrobiia bacterium]|nr:CHRD domain-containing protein [Acidimicrobiia bacterium]